MNTPVQPRWKSKAATLLGYLIRCEQWVAIACLATILVTMGLQVIARYFFKTPISWSEEVARLAMIWLTFIASSFVMARRQHITVDFFSGAAAAPLAGAPPSATGPVAVRATFRRLIQRLFAASTARLVVLVTTLMLLVGGLRFVWRVHPVGSPSTGISMTYWYGAASVGLALMALHTLADLVGIEPPAAEDATAEPSSDRGGCK